MKIEIRRPACVYCGGRWITLGGQHENGRQRFLCQDCGRSFVDPAKRTKRVPPPASASHMILKLQGLAERLGHTPASSEMKGEFVKGFPFNATDYVRVFGSWSEALRRARLVRNYRRVFDDNEKQFLLDQLRALSRRMGGPIRTDDVRDARRRGLVSPTTHFSIAFGSIAVAIREAGVAVKRKYSDEELIRILRDLDLRLDRPVEAWDIEELFRQGKCLSPERLADRFGGLQKARKAAGIRKKYHFAKHLMGVRQPRYTREQLIEQLQALGKRLGRRSTWNDIADATKGGSASTPTFTAMFGTMRDAYIAAGFTDTGPPRYSDKELIDELRSIKQELGHFPTQLELRALSRAGRCPSPDTIARRLGPLSELRRRF